MLNLQDSLLLYYTQAEVQFSIHFYFLQMCSFEGDGFIEAGVARGKKTFMTEISMAISNGTHFLWNFLLLMSI